MRVGWGYSAFDGEGSAFLLSMALWIPFLGIPDPPLAVFLMESKVQNQAFWAAAPSRAESYQT